MHSAGLFWTSDRLYLQNTQQRRQMNMNYLSWTGTRDPSNQAATDLALDCTATEIDGSILATRVYSVYSVVSVYNSSEKK